MDGQAVGLGHGCTSTRVGTLQKLCTGARKTFLGCVLLLQINKIWLFFFFFQSSECAGCC